MASNTFTTATSSNCIINGSSLSSSGITSDTYSTNTFTINGIAANGVSSYDYVASNIATQSYIQESINKLEKEIAEKYMKKENNTMNDFDFGSFNSADIRLSTYGIAIKNKTGKFVSYDAKAKRLIDVDILNVPVEASKIFYKFPKALDDISEGDIIIHNSNLVFVEDNLGNKINVINPYEGTEQTILPLRSPYGYDYVVCVISILSQFPEADEKNPFGAMLPLLLMKKDNNNNLLPFLLMRDSNIDPMTLALLGNNSGDILPFILMSQNKKIIDKEHAKS